MRREKLLKMTDYLDVPELKAEKLKQSKFNIRDLDLVYVSFLCNTGFPNLVYYW